MNCYNHMDRTAVARCEECGNYICNECIVDVNGKTICKSCVARLAGDKTNPRQNQQNNRRKEPIPPGMPVPMKDINAFFLFCLSAVPGLNYMYMGLMKRGLFFMSSFFLVFAIILFADFPALLMVVAIIMFYSFFDGFKIRREILAGKTVNDDVDDILPILVNNKGLIIFGVLALFGLKFLRSISYVLRNFFINYLGHDYYWTFRELFSSIIGLAILAVGAYIIYRVFFKKDEEDEDQNINQ